MPRKAICTLLSIPFHTRWENEYIHFHSCKYQKFGWFCQSQHFDHGSFNDPSISRVQWTLFGQIFVLMREIRLCLLFIMTLLCSLDFFLDFYPSFRCLSKLPGALRPWIIMWPGMWWTRRLPRQGRAAPAVHAGGAAAGGIVAAGRGKRGSPGHHKARRAPALPNRWTGEHVQRSCLPDAVTHDQTV